MQSCGMLVTILQRLHTLCHRNKYIQIHKAKKQCGYICEIKYKYNIRNIKT